LYTDISETVILLDQTSEHLTLFENHKYVSELLLGKSNNIIQMIYLAFYSRWKRSCRTHFNKIYADF